jgi:hypothetical protein
MRTADVTVSHLGTVSLFAPLSRRALAWVARRVCLESWQWQGGAFAVEGRYARPLARRMRAAGLRLD